MIVLGIMVLCFIIAAYIIIDLHAWQISKYKKNVVYHYTRKFDNSIRILFVDSLWRIWIYEFSYEDRREADRIYTALLNNKPYSIDQEPQLYWN